MSDRPKCIVCGRPIKKKTGTIRFRLASEENPHGTRHDSTGLGRWVELYLDELPANKAEAQRYTNDAIVHVDRRDSATLYGVSTWDGVSYEDQFFDTGTCAQKQGYASAQHGARFTWRKKDG